MSTDRQNIENYGSPNPAAVSKCLTGSL